MEILLTELLLLISFGLIYLIFLLYDLFKRGDNYGALVYIVAVLPADYLWYIMTKNEIWDFGFTGSMMILAGMWLLAIIRDIYLKDRKNGYKDADDVALWLVVGVVVNLIFTSVLPAFKSLNFMANSADKMLGYFYFPILNDGINYSPNTVIILIYRILVTLIVVLMIYPTVIDLRDARVNIVAIFILTLIFAVPFLFLAYVWAPPGSSGLIWVLLLLFSVLFFAFLLMITRGLNG